MCLRSPSWQRADRDLIPIFQCPLSLARGCSCCLGHLLAQDQGSKAAGAIKLMIFKYAAI